MSGRWKKIIWLICMAELCVIHGAYLMHCFLYRRKLLIIFFLLGTLLMAIFQYISYRRFIRDCVENITMLEDAKVQEAFREANLEAGNQEDTAHRIYVNSKIRIPFVMGVLKQSVILPKDCIKDENLPFLLLHECYHIRRHDTLYKYVMLACNCFLWFHPLAYFWRYISYRDIEVSCDEAVVRGKHKEERYRYGEFLLESAGKEREKGRAYSAYWNDSKAILKCRIQAVMEERRDWDFLAKMAVLFLIVEAVLLSIFAARNLMEQQKEINRPLNEFEAVAAPPIYSDEAIQEMLNEKPVSPDSYGIDLMEKYAKIYPEKPFEDIQFEPDGPWQFVLKRPAHFKDSLYVALQRFWYYMEDQEAFTSQYYDGTSGNTMVHIVYSDLLSGDIEDAVWGVVWKMYTSDYTQTNTYQEGYARTVGDDTDYLYFTTAVRIKMTEPYVFEAAGFADLDSTMEALKSKYPEADYADFPRLGDSKQKEEGYRLVCDEEQLYLENATGERIEVPIEKEWLEDPGDPLTGAVNGIRRECYQCDEKKVIFAYTNEEKVYVSMYENGSWKQVLVTDDYPYGLSKIYVDFPENSEVGYIYGVVERVVFQEGAVLLKTTDGGNSWETVPASDNALQHSLTMDFDFLTDQTGYLAIHTSYAPSAVPQLLRTEDGGITWTQVIFDKVPEYFCQAYAPELEDGRLVLYVGMEEYSEMNGEKAFYESTDDGRSWNYKNKVIRQ